MRSSRLALLFLSAAAFSGCGEKPPETSFEIANQGCLNEASTTMRSYFNGDVAESKLVAFWDCVDKALGLFTDRTRGETAGQYKPTELRTFLYRYFLDEKRSQISDKLLFHGMEVKSAFVGGRVEVLTSGEVRQARKLFSELRRNSLALRPVMPLSPERYRAASVEELESAVKLFEDEARALGQAIREASAAYPIQSFQELANELRGFLPEGMPATIRENMPLIKHLKSLLIKPSPERIEPDEWPEFLAVQAKAYGLYLRFEHLKTNYGDWKSGAGRERLVAIAREALDLLEESAERHPGRSIPHEDIQRLVDLVDVRAILAGAGVKLDSTANLKKTIPPIIQRFLGGNRTGWNGREADGLTAAAVNTLRETIERWNEGQLANELLEGGISPSGGFTGVIPGLLDFFQRIPSLFMNDNHVVVPPQAKGKVRTLHDSTQLHWMREVARLLIRGYARESLRASGEIGLTVEELHDAYMDVRDIGIELHAFDPCDPMVPEKRFLESNLFFYGSNGDLWLDQSEITQLFAFALSARVTGDEIHARLVKACYKPGEEYQNDIYGQPKIPQECYRRHFYGSFETHFAHLPQLVKYYRSLKPKAQHDFRKFMERGGAKLNGKDDWFDSGDSQSLAMYGSYVESIFAQYDQDLSGTLTKDEALRAFPRFKRILSEIQKETDEEKLKKAFLYLMKNGGPPKGVGDFLKEGIPWLIIVEWLDLDPKINADRIQVFEIFANFSDPTPYLCRGKEDWAKYEKSSYESPELP